MSNFLKNALKYGLMIAVTGFLLWIAFQNIEVAEGESKLDFIMKAWQSADKFYLILSALAAVISHVIRAERWKLLLTPLSHKLTLRDGFLSVMIGYFINLAIPRGGEVSRCYNLYRLNGTPVHVSLGTVVAERVIDLIFLLILIGITFLVQLDKLLYFFRSIDLNSSKGDAGLSISYYLVIGLILSVVLVYVIVRYLLKTRRYFTLRILGKFRSIIHGVKSGLLVVFRLEKNALFIAYSFLIWILYYLMSYFILHAFPETEHIGLMAALTIFVIGGIAIAVPLPGGAGSYHLLVPLGLVMLYGLEQDVATAYTFILHGWQTLVVIVLGALSLVLSQFYGKNAKKYSK